MAQEMVSPTSQLDTLERISITLATEIHSLKSACLPLEGSQENFIAFQKETLESYLPAVESEFRHRIENFFLKGLAACCFDRSSECLQIAGGGPRGDTWYADYVNEATNELTIDIIACYKATLQEVDTQQIDELQHQSRQACFPLI